MSVCFCVCFDRVQCLHTPHSLKLWTVCERIGLDTSPIPDFMKTLGPKGQQKPSKAPLCQRLQLVNRTFKGYVQGRKITRRNCLNFLAKNVQTVHLCFCCFAMLLAQASTVTVFAQRISQIKSKGLQQVVRQRACSSCPRCLQFLLARA